VHHEALCAAASSLEKVRARLAKSMPARNGFLFLLHGSIAWPEPQKKQIPSGTGAVIRDLVSRDI